MEIRAFIKRAVGNFKVSAKRWIDRDPIATSSTIAYCTIFSLPGLLVIIINTAGYFYDKGKVTTKVNSQMENIMGKVAAKDVISIMENAGGQQKNVLSSVISFLTLLLGATGVFAQLQKCLNTIWEVPPVTKKKFLHLLKDRLFSFGLILTVGFLLLVSLLLSAVLGVVSTWVTNAFSESFQLIFKALDFVVSFAVITLLFASIFKFLPDTKIRWHDVWTGAIITSLLFVIAKFALGLYFGHSKPESAYGAAGSIVLVMLWVSYSSIILLFGAEYTHASSQTKAVEAKAAA